MSPRRPALRPKAKSNNARSRAKALIGPLRMAQTPQNLGLPGVQGVYRITCLPLGKAYIGSSADVAGRWLQHQVSLWQQDHMNRNLQAAFNTFGPRAFTIEVLEILPGRFDADQLTLMEQRWMDKTPRRFNVRPAGSNAFLTKTKAGRAAVQAAQQKGDIPKFCRSTGRLAPTKGCRCYACTFLRRLKEPG